MRLKNVSIGKKLGLAFAAMVAAIAVMGAVLDANVSAMSAAGRDNTRSQAILTTVLEAKFYLSRQENSYRGYLISLDAYYTERVERHRANFKARLTTLRELYAGNEAELARVDATEAAADAWFENVVVQGGALARNPATHGSATAMVGPTGTADGFIEPAENAIEAIIEEQTAAAAAAAATLENASRVSLIALAIGFGAAIAIAVLLGFALTRTIARPS